MVSHLCESVCNTILPFSTVHLLLRVYWLNNQLRSGSRFNPGSLRRPLHVRRATSRAIDDMEARMRRIHREVLARCLNAPGVPPATKFAVARLSLLRLSHHFHPILPSLCGSSQTPLSQLARRTTPLRIHPLLIPPQGSGTARITISARVLTRDATPQDIYPSLACQLGPAA